MRSSRWMGALRVGALALTGLVASCMADVSETGVDSREIEASDVTSDVAVTRQAITGNVAVNTILNVAANLNLRSTASNAGASLKIMEKNSVVKVLEAAPSGVFYKVDSSGTTGWASGTYLKLAHVPLASNLSTTRAEALRVGRTAMGFSYWWGNATWPSATGATSSNAGTCTGSCGGNPACVHTGSYGADCSGLVSKVWKVPETNTPESSNHGPGTSVYNSTDPRWSTITNAQRIAGDAMVRYDGNVANGVNHIFIVAIPSDGNGFTRTYECKSCGAGCLSFIRDGLAIAGFKSIRRTGW